MPNPPGTAAQSAKDGDVIISFPLTDANPVPRTFNANGNYAEELQLTGSASMQQGQNPPIASTSFLIGAGGGLPNGSWLASFEDVPEGAGYTLTVTIDGVNATSTNITISNE